jgi:hypothetical protein
VLAIVINTNNDVRAPLPVVTYERQASNGTPAQVKVLKRSMPIVCKAVSVPSVTMFEVRDHLSVVLH